MSSKLRPVTQSIRFHSHLGGDPVNLSGDIHADITAICENLRIDLYSAVEEARVEMESEYPEYNGLKISPYDVYPSRYAPAAHGRSIRGASIALCFEISRPETQKEIEARLAKEEKMRLVRQKKEDQQKKKELDVLNKLAAKHGVRIETKEANEADEGS